MLISVHVPKTGGISFLEVLKARYGSRLRLDYSDRPMAHGTLGRLATTFTHRISAAREQAREYDCVHGHFLPIKYAFLKERSYAIWFRDPVELVVSRYHYFKRHLKPDDIQYKKYFKREDLSLAGFARLKHFHNVYAKYLFGMDLTDFDFVGITENYSASLEIFHRMYDIEGTVSEVKKNTNPDKPGARYVISEDLRTLIQGFNQKDLDIYRRALDMNNALADRYLR